jgi:hypothetical protein
VEPVPVSSPSYGERGKRGRGEEGKRVNTFLIQAALEIMDNTTH